MNTEMEKLAGEYAELADALLQDQGVQYTDEDVVKVANFLIDNDYPDEQEKTAEEVLDEIRTAAFYDEIEKQAGVKDTFARATEALEMLGHNMGMATLPEKLHGRLSKVERARMALGSHINRNATAYGTGTVGAGAGLVGGGGYAGYSALKKQAGISGAIGGGLKTLLSPKNLTRGQKLGLKNSKKLTSMQKMRGGASKFVGNHEVGVGRAAAGAAMAGSAAIGAGAHKLSS
jgi:hypothetical protein